MRKVLATLLIIGLTIPTVFLNPREVQAAASAIRQEINITDGYMYAASGSYATSSAIISVDGSKYSGTKTCYFEAVASTTAGTNATVELVTTAGASTASVTVNGGNTYQIYRSSSFTCPTSATEYKTRLGNEAIGKGILSSRVIVLQSFADDANSAATSTQTQIEMGTQLTATTSITSLPLQNPKYWTYSSEKWDSTQTAYAEVTYSLTAQVASSTTYASAGTFTYVPVASTTDVIIDAWGAGGAGFDGTNSGGGAGGGGGAFASSTIPTTASSYSMTVGTGGSTSGANGGNTTFNTTTVIAEGGKGGTGLVTSGGSGGLASNSTGVTKFNGGNGGDGTNADDTGGGGGGAAGPHGAGGNGAPGQATTGGGGGGGDGGNTSTTVTGGSSTNGGAGGNGGNAGNASAAGTSVNGGGGGGGGDNGTNGTNGGNTGGGGGGGEAIFGNGGTGQIKLTAMTGYVGIALEEDNGSFGGWTFKTQIVNKGTSTTATRVRSSSFIPTNGRHYRLVASTTASNITYNIHNGKIIMDQSGTTPAQDGNSRYFLSNAYRSTSNFTQYGTAAATFSLWVKATSTASFSVLMGINDTVSATLQLYKDTNYQFIVNGTGSATISSASVEDGNWHHIAGVYDGSNIKIYLDTVQQGSDVAFTSNINTSNPSKLDIGHRANGTGRFTGIISDVRVYNTGRTQAQIASDYNVRLAGNESNLTGYWKLNADKNDSTSNANNQTVTAGTERTIADTPIWGTGSVSKLEPGYQLAPFTLSSGTSLQKLLESFNTSEWSGVANTYLLSASASDNSTSVVVLQDSTGATTYATLSSPDNYSTTTLSCIPTSNTTWDTKASTNNNDVYEVQVLAQVSIGGAGGTSNCAGGEVAPKFFFINNTLRFTDGTVRFTN